MKRVFILNGAVHQPIAKGELNAALAARAKAFFEARGLTVRTTTIVDGYDVDAQIDHHRWADLILMQFPVNWMAMPWPMKKYMDEVYTAGMDGRLCVGDGRSLEAPKAHYGAAGALKGKKYMLSVTFNAPAEAFNDAREFLFAGKSVDDLMAPMHYNAKFFALEKLPTFSAHDVMKNPQIESDFKRFDAHLAALTGQLEAA